MSSVLLGIYLVSLVIALGFSVWIIKEALCDGTTIGGLVQALFWTTIISILPVINTVVLLFAAGQWFVDTGFFDKEIQINCKPKKVSGNV